MRYKNSAELKANARGTLLGRYGNVVPVQLAFMVLASGLSGFAVGTEGSWLRLVLYYAITMVCSILVGVLEAGLCHYYMNLCCGYQARFLDLFYGFRPGNNRPALISMLFLVYQIICVQPGAALLLVFRDSGSYAALGVSIAVLGVGLLAYYYVYLGLSQCYYLLLDFPEKSPAEVVRLSRYLMRDQRGRLCYIHLSFLPILLLCVLSFGVGLLWAMPYINATLTGYHLDLTSAAAGERRNT